ncbi:hypothetical protein [Bifidobacterium anseris]|uniref:hypothetical protein n=1 Tax=Bifidobacterium anseris TaxID=2020963 RepID=UPI000C7586BD|nr:hypothetical protein [Bifidobacterium anseris]
MAWSMGATAKTVAEQAFYDALVGDAVGSLAGKVDQRCLDMLSDDAAGVYVRSACKAIAEFVF